MPTFSIVINYAVGFLTKNFETLTNSRCNHNVEQKRQNRDNYVANLTFYSVEIKQFDFNFYSYRINFIVKKINSFTLNYTVSFLKSKIFNAEFFFSFFDEVVQFYSGIKYWQINCWNWTFRIVKYLKSISEFKLSNFISSIQIANVFECFEISRSMLDKSNSRRFIILPFSASIFKLTLKLYVLSF